MKNDPDAVVPRAAIPADVEAPDKIIYGLTARQVAILATAGIAAYWLWKTLWTLHASLPAAVGAVIPILGMAAGLAMGKRDGLSLDRWFLAAIMHRRTPSRQVAAPDGIPSAPEWAPAAVPNPQGKQPRPSVLRLPANAISDGGVIDLGGGTATTMVAATTTNINLRTGDEQYALLGAYARWLNSLSGPVQVAVSAQRVDLSGHAQRIADTAATLAHPALADAALDYGDFLLDIAVERDPLWRTVTIACTAAGGKGAPAEALRRGEYTAGALSALGVQARVLDGPTATAVLAAAVDPYQYTDASWARALPTTAVAGEPVDRGPTDGGYGMSLLDLLLPLRSNKNKPAAGRDAHGDMAQAASLAAVIGPGAVEVGPRSVRVGDGYACTLVVTGYPTEVGPAWLDPLLSWPGRLDVTLHIEPIATADAANRLRRQRARLESSRRFDADKGRLGDPQTDAAAEDAADLADRLARGQSRLFRVGVYLTVHAMTPDELVEAVAEVRATAASVLLDTHPVTWRQLQGWTTTLPLGVDSIRMRRVFDTDSLAATFPLASADLPAPLPGDGMPTGGVLYGLNTDSAGIVWWDRWAQHNHNSVVLARSGAGKSYFVKLDVLRSLYEGVQVSVIDPEDEYMRLAAAVGGVTLQIGAPGVRLNPFDLPAADRRPDALTRRALFLHTLISVLLGQQPPPSERAALDRAIIACYANAGITNDPTTWTRPAPLLRDLTATLAGDGDPAAATLAARLTPWVSGSFKDLFDGPTTVAPKGHLVVWSTRQLPDELHAPGMLLALDAIWREVDQQTQPGRRGGFRPEGRRLVVVDEAWTLLRDGEGARFLFRLAKAARKRKAGVMVITQDAADLLGSDLGQAVVANAATQILMRQAPQAIDVVADTFGLTAGEARRLLSAGRGEALLLSGSHRVSFQSVASKAEHRLAAGLADLVDDDL